MKTCRPFGKLKPSQFFFFPIREHVSNWLNYFKSRVFLVGVTVAIVKMPEILIRALLVSKQAI